MDKGEPPAIDNSHPSLLSSGSSASSSTDFDEEEQHQPIEPNSQEILSQPMDWQPSPTSQEENVTGTSGDESPSLLRNETSGAMNEEEFGPEAVGSEMEVEPPEIYQATNGCRFRLYREALTCRVHGQAFSSLYRCNSCGLVMFMQEIEEHAAIPCCCCHWYVMPSSPPE